jgi:formamidopyrimidine-DNA glycosylase
VIKSVLLDQHAVAGLGNLCVDEVLWWSDLDPRRTTDSLSPTEVERLATMIRRRLPVMLARGGSTTGVLSPAVRATCPPCERDGTPLERDAIGGRTTIWCPGHQR